MAFSDRFYYIAPVGVLAKADMPEWAGLMLWNGELFETAKRAPVRFKQEPTWEFIVSLMRNCGQSRRDVGLIKAQLAFFEMQHKRQVEIERMNSRFTMQRWQEAVQVDVAE